MRVFVIAAAVLCALAPGAAFADECVANGNVGASCSYVTTEDTSSQVLDAAVQNPPSVAAAVSAFLMANDEIVASCTAVDTSGSASCSASAGTALPAGTEVTCLCVGVAAPSCTCTSLP